MDGRMDGWVDGSHSPRVYVTARLVAVNDVRVGEVRALARHRQVAVVDVDVAPLAGAEVRCVAERRVVHVGAVRWESLVMLGAADA